MEYTGYPTDVPVLLTPRLILLPLSRAVLESRLQAERFTLPVLTGSETLTVSFSPDWPGDALAAFPFFFTQLDRAGELPGTFIAVERRSSEAAGLLGSKGNISTTGDLEIGYGFRPPLWGQGYATEAVAALVQHLHGWEGVRRVTAQTARGNLASEEVLRKNGFDRIGESWSAEDGPLHCWAHEYSPE